MHERVVVERKAAAQERISAAVEKLAKRFGLEGGSLPGLAWENLPGLEPEVRDMRRVEALADFLEILAGAQEIERQAAIEAEAERFAGSDQDADKAEIASPGTEPRTGTGTIARARVRTPALAGGARDDMKKGKVK